MKTNSMWVLCRIHYAFNEMKYNLQRMWGKYGLRGMFRCENGMCYFKFANEEGLNRVVESGPWLVKISL